MANVSVCADVSVSRQPRSVSTYELHQVLKNQLTVTSQQESLEQHNKE